MTVGPAEIVNALSPNHVIRDWHDAGICRSDYAKLRDLWNSMLLKAGLDLALCGESASSAERIAETRQASVV